MGENFCSAEKKSKEKEISRREFLKALGIGAVGAAAICSGMEKVFGQEASIPSRYEKHGWFYTLEEMKKVYDNEYQSQEKILKNVFRKENKRWTGMINGEKFEVPQKFIDKTLEHFKEMLENKTARYLFRLDAGHGHLFVSEDAFKAGYGELNSAEHARKLVGDKTLGVLFHNFEHDKLLDKETDELTAEEKEIKEKRNVVGWYDGRLMEILPLPKDNKCSAASAPGRDLSPYLKIAAHKDGELAIIVEGKEIRLDISFDDQTYY